MTHGGVGHLLQGLQRLNCGDLVVVLVPQFSGAVNVAGALAGAERCHIAVEKLKHVRLAQGEAQTAIGQACFRCGFSPRQSLARSSPQSRPSACR